MSSAKRLAREILDTRRLALGHATSPQLTSSSLDGGQLDITDGEGNRIGGLGLGDDGGFKIDYTGGPKPPKPSPPTVTADAGMFRVEWDGSFVNEGDEGVLATSDTDRVEIHASMDENFVPDRVESFGGAFATLDGGSFTLGPLPEAGTYYFRLVARSKSAQFSEPSERVEQTLAITSIDLEVIDAWLTGEAAQTTADGKNSIWRGPDEPVADPDRPFKDGDIWFEMTEDGKSIPNIWDEATGTWVGNDDYRQSEIERVQQELRDDLDAIVVDGSGTKNFYTPTMPTEGMREGDLWFDSSDKNKPYIYQDGEWITVRDSFAQPGAAAEIVGVALESATSNQWSNTPGFSYTAQTLKAEVPAGAPPGGAKLVIPFQGAVNASGIPVIAGSTVSTQGLPVGVAGDLLVKSADVAPTAKLHARFQGGPWPDGFDYSFNLLVEPYTIGGSTHQLKWDTAQDVILSTYGPLMESIGFALEVNISSTAGSYVDFNTGALFTGRLQVPGPGVADGAITTGKIAAGAITAESGIIGSINAGTITVGEMDGARIKAGTVDADTVLVESSIGSTLIKDGAILTDHIKVGAITAESGIIGSIDANVITVGKIMGNQLDADAINGKTITGATIRTASSGSRVELTHNGLKQYNSLGATIVDMTAGSFTLQGGSITGSTIKTATSGSRVEINTQGLKQYNSSNEVIAEMVDGSMVMRGILEQTNSVSKFQVGPAFTGGTSPGIRWDNITGTTGTAAIAVNGPSGGLGATMILKGPGSSSAGALAYLYSDRALLVNRAAQESYLDLRTDGATIMAGGSLDLWGGDSTLLTLGKDGTGARVWSMSIYNRTYTGQADLCITTAGTLGRRTSARKYKAEEQTVSPDSYADALLSIEHKSWYDREELERSRMLAKYREENPMTPITADLAEAMDESELPRHVGAIADDFDEAGLSQFVTYGDYGQVEGLQYNLIGVALIPIVKQLRDRIEELEALVAA